MLCNRSNVYACDYNFDESFQKSVTTWRVELMLSVANRIAKFFTDESASDSILVRWKDYTKCIEFIYKLEDC